MRHSRSSPVAHAALVALALACERQGGALPDGTDRRDAPAAADAAAPLPVRLDPRPTPPLRRHAANPRYFDDGSGRAVYLTGSHTWNSVQDWGAGVPALDYDAFLDFLAAHGHSFTRLWVWEQARVSTGAPADLHPMLWRRVGPDTARDGRSKYDLDDVDPAYLARLRARVAAAGARGIYASVMLFQEYVDWESHPFHGANNVNGVDADADGDGDGDELHTLGDPAVLRRQEAYARAVVEAVGDLPNVLYEIGNEHRPRSVAWQHHLVRVVQAAQVAHHGEARPVGMTTSGGATGYTPNAALLASAADWISPHDEPSASYSYDPPPADGRKVVVTDSDHLAGMLGIRDSTLAVRWVWRSFLAGLHPILMDAYHVGIPGHEDAWWNDPANPSLPATRRALGHTRAVADRVELAAMRPLPALASSGSCLAQPAGTRAAYLVFVPVDTRRLARLLRRRGRVEVDLRGSPGSLEVAWLDPRRGLVHRTGAVAGGGTVAFTAPFAGDAVLYLRGAAAPRLVGPGAVTAAAASTEAA